jgi:hypothetical protein
MRVLRLMPLDWLGRIAWYLNRVASFDLKIGVSSIT